MLTAAALAAVGIAPAWLPPLEAASRRFEITTRPRAAAFLAQVAHESSGGRQLEELLSYSTPERIRAIFPSRVPSLAAAALLVRNPQRLANTVYAGRNGNGDAASGDGFRFRGRGMLQITGRANYRVAGVGCGQPYEAAPDLLLQPEHAARSAAWWWQDHGCNALADTGRFDAITRVINGPATTGAPERQELYKRALTALA